MIEMKKFFNNLKILRKFMRTKSTLPLKIQSMLFILCTILTFTYCNQSFANVDAIMIVQKELMNHKSEYKILDVLSIDYLGVQDRKYLLNVTYTQNMCESTNCSDYKCSTKTTLDSDAVVEFEPEMNSKKCEKIKSKDTINKCVESCYQYLELISEIKQCVMNCQK